MSLVSLNCGSIRADEQFLTALVALKLDTMSGIFAYSGKGYQRTHAGHDNFHVVEEIDGVGYDLYLKRHRNFKLKEALKLLAARSPFVTAGRREWENILALEGLGIHTMRPVAFGEKKIGCFELRSFVIAEKIPRAQPLDDYLKSRCTGTLEPAALREKRALLWDLGDMARRLHAAGLTHMDFYANHVFVRETQTGEKVLHLIDLQRLAKRWLFARRWKVKDLAALIYSLRDLALPRTDFARIFTAYSDGTHSTRDHKLIRAALKRAGRMTARGKSRAANQP